MSRSIRFVFLFAFLTSQVLIVSCGGGNGPVPPSSIHSSPTVIQTQYGALRGVATGNLYAFRGIPYAAPPVGNLRWKVPQAPTAWKGVRDASKFGNVCPQINYNGQLVGSEDCLTLNVFVSQKKSGKKQPVMIFLHGGGNARGDAQSAPFDAPPLATKGVVVVTLEYRVGMLGFFANPQLTTEGGGASGHYGLMDIIAALTWVQQNIAAFGGDPQHVMLFGQSAGSYDIQMLLAAPAAQGLFAVAGMESNVIPGGQLPSFSSVETADQGFVAAVGCSSAADVLSCLRAVPADTIVNLGFSWPGGPGIGSTFLPRDPFVDLQQNGSPVPLMIGSTREEWAGVSDNPNTPLNTTGYSNAIHQRFDPVGPTVASQVLSLYPAGAYSTPAYALIAVDSDYNMTCEVRTVARAAAGTNRKPVWRYLYVHDFENDLALKTLGAFHTSELYFIFGNYDPVSAPNLGVTYTPTAAEQTFSQDLMGYWTRFADTGDPNGSGAVTWPMYDPSADSMLQLDDTFLSINGYHNPECNYLVTLPQP